MGPAPLTLGLILPKKLVSNVECGFLDPLGAFFYFLPSSSSSSFEAFMFYVMFRLAILIKTD